MADGDAPALAVRELSKTFPGAQVLRGVTLDVGRGRVHALLGHNGSGKSTLVKILAGIHVPDRGGEVDVAGTPLHFGSPRDSHRLGLRFVHQDLGLVEQLSAAENMALTWSYPRTPLRTIRWRAHAERVQRALAELGVSCDVDAPVGQLRPVQQTAVAIARALGDVEAPITALALDEPTAALPPAEVEVLFDLLRDLARTGVSIVYVSHRLEEVLDLADDASILRDGVLERSGPLDGMGRSELARLIVGDVEHDRPAPSAPRGAPDRSNRSAGAPTFDVEVSTATLRSVRITLARGEIVGVAGLSGSGREEICAAVVGAVPGRCTVVDRASGARHDGLTPARARDLGIALVLPNRSGAAAVSAFTVRENVSLPSLGRRSLAGFVRSKAERLASMRWIASLDILPADPEQIYGLLSGGNQQKTVLAKWLAIEPSALLLDDPTGGVDVGARARIYELIRQQATDGLSVLVASSDIEDLVALCDRVVVLSRGVVTQEVEGDDVEEHVLLDALNRVSAGG